MQFEPSRWINDQFGLAERVSHNLYNSEAYGKGEWVTAAYVRRKGQIWLTGSSWVPLGDMTKVELVSLWSPTTSRYGKF